MGVIKAEYGSCANDEVALGACDNVDEFVSSAAAAVAAAADSRFWLFISIADIYGGLDGF